MFTHLGPVHCHCDAERKMWEAYTPEALCASRLRRRRPARGLDLVPGDRVIENAAWSFRKVVDFDDRIAVIRGRIAFDRAKGQVTEMTVVDA